MRSGEQLNKRIQLKLHYFFFLKKHTFKSKVTVSGSKTGPEKWARDVDLIMIKT